jgi:Tol biopolymer transport system component
MLLAISAEPASSANARASLSFDEKSINGVDAYTWASKGSTLVYATSDGTLWSVNGPDFATPTRIINIALPDEQNIRQIVWSPDGQNIAVVSPRSNNLWDTIWLVNLRTSELRDLLPPGAPFGGPGRRSLRISYWFPDGRMAFVMHCGTGCVGLHAVQTQGSEGYWDFCDATGDFFWSPNEKDAVVENRGQTGGGGLGLVSASDGVAVATGASYYRPRKECSSVFTVPFRRGLYFNSWFPDSKTVLYTDAGLNSSQLKLWNTVSGVRTTLVAGGSSGALSPDGRYICFISPEHETATTRLSKRVLLKILDLQGKRIVASREIPTVLPAVQWSPSTSYLAVLTGEDKLLLASFSPDGIRVRQTDVTAAELSWSANGKYLAVRDHFYAPAKITILKFPFDAAPSTGTTPGMPHQ